MLPEITPRGIFRATLAGDRQTVKRPLAELCIRRVQRVRANSL